MFSLQTESTLLWDQAHGMGIMFYPESGLLNIRLSLGLQVQKGSSQAEQPELDCIVQEKESPLAEYFLYTLETL